MTTYPTHIQDQANKMLALGTKMTFEAICEMYMKKESKAAKKGKASEKKFEARAAMETMTAAANPSQWLAEKNRENAMASLPSSLR